MNGHLSWFRLWSETVDDEKLRLLAFEDRWHFVAILCCKAQGLLDQPGDLMLRKIAVKLGLQVRELDEVVRRLVEVGLIETETLQPVAWDKRQRASDRSAERVREFRARKHDETLQKRFSNAAEAEAETETEGGETPPPPVTVAAQKPAKPAKPTADDIIPQGVDPSAWQDFCQHRREIRKPLTDLAARKCADVLRTLPPHCQRESVNASIANRWTGVFPPKTKPGQTQGGLSREEFMAKLGRGEI